ncbi:MAG: hypothetical protein ACXVB0_13080 [Mucilaginibacter sp.]
MINNLKSFFTRNAEIASCSLIYVITPPAHNRFSAFKVVGSIISVSYFVLACVR